LYRTGDQSRDVVLVLATNRPSDLDAAITDRIDEVIEFPSPGEGERIKLLKLYLDRYITQAHTRQKAGWFSNVWGKPDQIELKGITDNIIREAARKMDGFSGREIAKALASVQGAVYGSKRAELDAGLFMEVIDYKVKEHCQRQILAAKGNSR
jgi:ATPase family AAA domain-containing protein 3A/B